jgi:hypothetical protein
MPKRLPRQHCRRQLRPRPQPQPVPHRWCATTIRGPPAPIADEEARDWGYPRPVQRVPATTAGARTQLRHPWRWTQASLGPVVMRCCRSAHSNASCRVVPQRITRCSQRKARCASGHRSMVTRAGSPTACTRRRLQCGFGSSLRPEAQTRWIAISPGPPRPLTARRAVLARGVRRFPGMLQDLGPAGQSRLGHRRRKRQRPHRQSGQ